MIKDYIEKHTKDGRYNAVSDTRAQSTLGWEDCFVSPFALLSHRKTHYTQQNFAERLHSHDFYELVLYIGGEVEYTNGDLVYRPEDGILSVIINRPGESHTTRLLRPGVYERYVLYFDSEFLSFFGSALPFSHFLDTLSNFALTFDEATSRVILTSFEDAVFNTADQGELDVQKAYIGILTVFHSLCAARPYLAEVENIPENILKIKSYVDESCKQIKNVNAIAESFFYSREHLSRTFKKYFNINLADYLAQRKCEESKAMLLGGMSVSDVCFACGFGSVPSYLRAFKRFCRMTPSEYVRTKRE